MGGPGSDAAGGVASARAEDVENGTGGGAAAADEFRKRTKTFAPGGGCRIVFKDLEYTVPSNVKKGETVSLLSKVSGYFQPHEMSALMGPSGSGKTTLLDVLAGRKTAGKTSGTISYAGQPPSSQFLRRYTGYVEQFDTLIAELTVEEMLLYTAELKRPRTEPLADKKAAVEQLMDKLALLPCRAVRIGSPLARGVSGGQAKRVNIGIALITNPRVLFLDEPTSGLDSFTSNEVMTVVKQLTSDGTTICATIHSPTAYCFALFDRLAMLVRGRVVYFGPVKDAVSFAISSCPKGIKEKTEAYNDAEFLVDLVTEADRKGQGAVVADQYAASQQCRVTAQEVDRYLEEKEELPDHIKAELEVKSATVTPWWWGFRTLVKYRTTKNYRDPNFLGPRIGDKVFITLLIMTLYLGIGNDFDSGNLINTSAMLFMWCTLPAFGAAAYVPALVLERSLFVRERADGLYRVITYLLHKMFDELFIAAIATACAAAWTFYGIQLAGEWICFWLVYYCTLANGIALAYLVATLAPNLDVANAMLPTYVVTLLFFAGFLFRLDKIPPWWKWYSYIDLIRYSWGAVMVNQFSTEKHGDPELFPAAANGGSPVTVLQYYSLDGVNKWNYVGYLALFFIFWFTCTWLLLAFRKFTTR